MPHASRAAVRRTDRSACEIGSIQSGGFGRSRRKARSRFVGVWPPLRHESPWRGGFSVTGPVWVLAVLVNDPATLDNSIRRLVDVFNSELTPEIRPNRSASPGNRRRRSGLPEAGQAPLSSPGRMTRLPRRRSDRGAAARAIATRNGGRRSLSAAFQRQLPRPPVAPAASLAEHEGVLQGSRRGANTTLQKLIAERDPILAFSADDGTIHAASRTRLRADGCDDAESLSRLRTGSRRYPGGRAQPGTR